MKEVWESIQEFDGYYEVSNLGRVKSLYRKVGCSDGRVMTIQERILKPGIGHLKEKCKYYFVRLCVEGKCKTREIHRLMGLTFLNLEKGKYMIIHKNHNTLDNNLINLKCVSPKDKAKQAWDIGFQVSASKGKFGSKSMGAKPIAMCDMEDHFIRVFGSRIDASHWLIKNGFAPNQQRENIISAINRASNGTTKFSYGHKWINT